jgi:hypothetical protein
MTVKQAVRLAGLRKETRRMLNLTLNILSPVPNEKLIIDMMIATGQIGDGTLCRIYGIFTFYSGPLYAS